MHALCRCLRFLAEYKLFGVAIVAIVAGLVFELSEQHVAAHWVLGVISIFAVLPIVTEMWQDLRTGRYGIDILAVTAIVTSVILRQYWAAIVIVVMFTGGEALEDYAERRAHSELDALLSRVPSQTTIIRKGKTLEVQVSDIRVGDLIIVKPGEVVPADAAITEGTANFDESSLTGESLPQAKKTGDQLLSGAVNIDGAVTAKCIRAAKDSQYEQIIKLVRAAQNAQAPVVRLADRYSVPFTFASYSIALAAWYFGHHAIRFLEVIVVATPCPLLLAAPIAIISGMSRASKHGIIVKTGGALEQLAQARTVAFDKTGTLTLGSLSVDKVTTFGSYKTPELLALAAALEQSSNHVLAHAIVTEAKRNKASVPKAKQVKEVAGQGLRASVRGRDVLVGRLDFLQSNRVELLAKLGKAAGATATYVAIDGKLAGIITFKDTIRDESKTTIKTLQRRFSLDTLMITGDNAASAQAVARTLGIKHVHADMLPGDKLHVLEEVTQRPVVFVGDGVNDAPVLTAADVGIALGAKGSTAASESADMVIMLDDLSRVVRAVEIARRTFMVARQSILGGIALSVILMFIFATGHFPPLAGAIIQELVDVIVIFNALRAHASWHRAET
ncbi:MAG TPA: heavy metal translocating P-type ATPase [Candidatus Saccharimonadales bacterium]|jgi:heavy metal translocating P-type ATPase